MMNENDINKIIGQRVKSTNTNAVGVVTSIRGGIVEVDFHGNTVKYSFPSAFGDILVLEDEEISEDIISMGMEASFKEFKNKYLRSIETEIDFLKSTGGKKYRIIDGERIDSGSGGYLYAFETDADIHYPADTAVKLWFPDNIVGGYIVSCEDFTILIRTIEYIGETIESVEFTSEQWQLLESLKERIDELDYKESSLASEIALNGKRQVSKLNQICCGQNAAFKRATSEPITFIWGPPGTGKTETLANIALEHIQNGRRVLMLSYSNVSVDGALLRVAKKADLEPGAIIRYGYPRTKELLESETLTSYQYVLNKDPSLAKEFKALNEKKKKLKRNSVERVEINKRLNKIRSDISFQESETIRVASFVATTVSKATVDRSLFTQQFDVVIFDEASMAYVPQIVFSASLSKDYFVCLGDFCQLPAIVQNRLDDTLEKDIYDFTNITYAVENNWGHNWLVMLNIQYRMHPDIADFVSENMYQNRLITSERIIPSREEMANCLPNSGSALSLFDLSGMYSVCSKTMDGSRINVLSAMICIRLAEQSINNNEVGIITPYSAQSRLIISMIRDLQEIDDKWHHVSCATVHQFQGSEKPVIIYDAVDCFRFPYPGVLLTSLKNDTANRLFNVAITRAKGKFILVANVDYLRRKKISKKLIFTKSLSHIEKEDCSIKGQNIISVLQQDNDTDNRLVVSDREHNWDKFIDDLKTAKKQIHIEIPDVIDDRDNAIDELIKTLDEKSREKIDITIRIPENIDIPQKLNKYVERYPFVLNPVTIIDKEIVWFGQPLYACDFISEGNIIDTLYFPTFRFNGKHMARSLKAFLEI